MVSSNARSSFTNNNKEVKANVGMAITDKEVSNKTPSHHMDGQGIEAQDQSRMPITPKQSTINNNFDAVNNDKQKDDGTPLIVNEDLIFDENRSRN